MIEKAMSIMVCSPNIAGIYEKTTAFVTMIMAGADRFSHLLCLRPKFHSRTSSILFIFRKLSMKWISGYWEHPRRANAFCWIGVGIVNWVKQWSAVFFIRHLFRHSVASSARRVLKLWTGRPSPVCLAPFFVLADLDDSAGFIGWRVLRSVSSSSSSNSMGARVLRICHST